MYKSWTQVDSDEQNSKKIISCSPREELNVCMWSWDASVLPKPTQLTCENRQVDFHPGYSAGTAAAKGNTPFVAGHDYYWEIQMLSSLYGTDVMVGIGTARCDVRSALFHFCSLLGRDQESWGFSYCGKVFHNGVKNDYGQRFNMNDVVGVHLDTWNGNLSFYVNGQPHGIAYKSINCQEELYPMVCSTAAFSSMKLIYAYSSPSSLQNLSLRALTEDRSNLSVLSSIPGLAKLPIQQLIDEKSFAPEPVLSEDDSESHLANFMIADIYEAEDDLPNTCYNWRRNRKRRKQSTDDLKPTTSGKAMGFSVEAIASSSVHCTDSKVLAVKNLDTRSDGCCSECGAKFPPNRSNMHLLRPLPRRRVLMQLCNVCAIIV